LAICSASSEEKQNGAWQFIRMFACEEFQSDHYIEYDAEHDSYGEERGFPININVYNEKAQEAMNGVFSSETVSFGGNQKAVGFLTQEEFEYLTDYINNVKAIDTSIDDSLKEIVEEEINAYFDGEIPAEQAADLIQNRASILVSERN
jgi:ABC-type glycerol-3-phosphate transport system substrate-binding protein